MSRLRPFLPKGHVYKFLALLVGLMALAVGAYPPSASALVDMKQANFSKTWVDIPDHFARTYNSRCLYKGIFGYGWGTDFETHLEVIGANIEKVQSGCGRSYRFGLTPESAILLAEKGLRTSDVMLAKGPTIADLSRLGDAILTLVPVDRTYESADILTLNKNGFYLKSPREGDQEYSLDGRLVRSKSYLIMVDHTFIPSGGFSVKWNGKEIEAVTFPGENSILTFSHPKSNVMQLDATIGGTSTQVSYEFDAKGDLSNVTSTDRTVTHFGYDEIHNITEIDWPDGTSNLLVYDNDHDWVKMFKAQDDCVENYEYYDNPVNPTMDFTSEMTQTCGNEIVSHKVWHFIMQTNSAGLTHDSQVELITEEKGQVKHEVYKYDDTGRLINKASMDNSAAIPYGNSIGAYFDDDHRLLAEPVVYLPVKPNRIYVIVKQESLTKSVATQPSNFPPEDCASLPEEKKAGRFCNYRKVAEVFVVASSNEELQTSALDGIALNSGHLTGIRTGGVTYTVQRDIKSGNITIKGGKIKAFTNINELAHQLSRAEFQQFSLALQFGGKHLVVATLMNRESRPAGQ